MRRAAPIHSEIAEPHAVDHHEEKPVVPRVGEPHDALTDELAIGGLGVGFDLPKPPGVGVPGEPHESTVHQVSLEVLVADPTAAEYAVQDPDVARRRDDIGERSKPGPEL